MQYAKSLSQKIIEAEDGVWITTGSGHKVFIGGQKAADYKARAAIKSDINNRITIKEFDEKAAEAIQNKFPEVQRKITAVDKQAVIDAMAKLPESHQKLVDKIIIEGKPTVESFVDKDNHVVSGLKTGELITNMGTYESEMHIYPTFVGKFGESRAARSVPHEVGHAVYNQLNVDTQREWKNMHYTGGYKPNEYAATNSRENFAEHYRMYSDKEMGKAFIEKSTSPSQLRFLKRVYEKV